MDHLWIAYDRDGQELGRLALAGWVDAAEDGQRFTVEMQQQMYRSGDEDATGTAKFTHVVDVYQHSPLLYEERLHVQINGRPVGLIVYTQQRDPQLN
jgi:hypothetical protein